MECFAKIVNGYNYLDNLFSQYQLSRSLLYEINIVIFFNAGLLFTPEVFILRKKVWEPRGPGGLNFAIPSTKLGKSNKPVKCIDAKLTELSFSNYEF